MRDYICGQFFLENFQGAKEAFCPFLLNTIFDKIKSHSSKILDLYVFFLEPDYWMILLVVLFDHWIHFNPFLWITNGRL